MMHSVFYWTGVVVWGFIMSGAVIILFALISGHIARGIKKQVRK